MLNITYKGRICTIDPQANVQIEAKAGYGNNGIHWQSGGCTAAEIIAAVAPRQSERALAVKFNDTLRPLDYYIASDGVLEIITSNDAEGLAICLNTAAFFWDKAMFELLPALKRRRQSLPAPLCRLEYFADALLAADAIDQLKQQTITALAAGVLPETILLAPEDAMRFYRARDEWYQAAQIAAEESDYPYKFRVLGDYAMRNDFLFCPHGIAPQDLLIEQALSSDQDKRFCTITLQLVF